MTQHTRHALWGKHDGEALGPEWIRFKMPPVRTLEEMSQVERAALRVQYGCPVGVERFEFQL